MVTPHATNENSVAIPTASEKAALKRTRAAQARRLGSQLPSQHERDVLELYAARLDAEADAIDPTVTAPPPA
jgi:hypothetical protein